MKALALAHRAYRGFTPTGGAETMLASIMEHLAEQGHEASAVLIGRGREHKVVNGVNVHRRKTDTDMHDLICWADVIITHLGGTALAKYLGAKFHRPVIQLIHNNNEFTHGFLGSGCDFAIYNTEWIKESCDRIQPQLLRVLQPDTKSSVLQMRRHTQWPSVVFHPPTTGPYVGGATTGKSVTLINLVPNKGPDVFYALAEMNPNIQFMGVIGGYEEDHQVIRSLPNVTIHDHVSDVSEVYRKTSVLLVPSVYESYGRVAVEAMQYGIPVIGADTPGLRECLNGAGTIISRDDISGWDAALHDILDGYLGYQTKAQHRYEQLHEQTRVEYPALVEAIEGVARGDHINC